MERAAGDHEGKTSEPSASVDLRTGESPDETSSASRAVLIVGVDDWAIRDASGRMQGAGWTVHHCSDSADAPFPCNAVSPGRGCPLNQHRVEVVLDVRSRPATELLLSEMGSVCGLRDGLPLVLAGPAEGTSLAPWARLVPAGGDLVAACTRVVEDEEQAAAGAGATPPVTHASSGLEGAT